MGILLSIRCAYNEVSDLWSIQLHLGNYKSWSIHNQGIHRYILREIHLLISYSKPTDDLLFFVFFSFKICLILRFICVVLKRIAKLKGTLLCKELIYLSFTPFVNFCLSLGARQLRYIFFFHLIIPLIQIPLFYSSY